MHRLALLLLAPLLLIGCAGKPLATVDRAKFGRVGFHPKIEQPKRYAYSDATIAGTAAVSSNFGLVGALVGAAAISGQESAGRKKVDGVMKAVKIDPAPVLAANFRREVEALKHFDTQSATPDATFHLKILSWGFTDGGAKRLTAQLTASANLIARDGKSVWKRNVAGVSTQSATIEEFQANPQRYARSFADAAEVCARKLAGEWE